MFHIWPASFFFRPPGDQTQQKLYQKTGQDSDIPWIVSSESRCNNITHRIHGAAIYGNITINIPPMLVYIPYMEHMYYSVT